MELSENLKLRLENLTGENQPDRAVRATNSSAGGDTEASDEAESQMRKALGLLGEGQRHRSEPERLEQQHRGVDRFNAGLHRRRFVQDGDIPVTVLRRDQGHDLPAHRGVAAVVPPTTSRLQRTEAALAAETAARERAERSLAEVQALAHDLRTKIGHAELAKNEAVEALQRERDVITQLRADARASDERLQEALAQIRGLEQAAQSFESQLADERHARKAVEKALKVSENARETAEQLVRALSEETAAPRRVETTRKPRAEPEVVAATTSRRPRAPEVPAVEPEPVKWWLNPKPAGKRR
jgi:DNA repair exonuclease SbcCD ATPase subunit